MRLFTFANFLTFLRLFLAPVIAVLIFNGLWNWAFLCFLLAATTDFLDGFLARLFKEESRWGAFWDPIADKLFLLTCFGVLSFVSLNIPLWFLCLLFFREILILGGSFFLLIYQKRSRIQPLIWGKLNTFFQLLFLGGLFVDKFYHFFPRVSQQYAIIFLTFFSIFSFLKYLQRGLEMYFYKK